MCTDRERTLLNLWFCSIAGVGAKTRKKLRECFGEPENIFQMTEKALCEVIQDADMVSRILKSKDMQGLEEQLCALESRNIKVVYPGHPSYPVRLYHIYDPPDILYVRGIIRRESHIYNSSIGIVGSRKPDIYGREMAGVFARKLAGWGCTIVSGLARGVDSAAHRGALEAGGYTMAVLGCGIDVTYPPENAELYHQIEYSGAIISEYGLGVSPQPGFFPMRNRIISGLSDGVLVVEAKKKSGSLITADSALEQGRQVYALPGRAYDQNSEGTNNLIKQGAICVTEPEDILKDLNIGEDSNMQLQTEIMSTKDDDSKDIAEDVVKNSLAPVEKMVYSCLSLEPMYIDDIIQHSGIGITNVISILYGLEERGVIKQPVRGYYILAV